MLYLLQEKVIQWAEERGIFSKATPIKQAFKTLEECGELIEGIAQNDKDKTIDAIGDVVVTLIIQCEMNGLKLDECLLSAYNQIKDRKGNMVGGTFVKEN